MSETLNLEATYSVYVNAFNVDDRLDPKFENGELCLLLEVSNSNGRANCWLDIDETRALVSMLRRAIGDE